MHSRFHKTVPTSTSDQIWTSIAELVTPLCGPLAERRHPDVVGRGNRRPTATHILIEHRAKSFGKGRKAILLFGRQLVLQL